MLVDEQNWKAQMGSVNVGLGEMRARIDATHSIITSRQHVEATVNLHDEVGHWRSSGMSCEEPRRTDGKDVSNALQQMQEKEKEYHGRTSSSSSSEMNTKLDTKVRRRGLKRRRTTISMQRSRTVRDVVSSMHLEVDAT